MLELTMAASRYDQAPTIPFQHLEDVANLHAFTELRGILSGAGIVVLACLF